MDGGCARISIRHLILRLKRRRRENDHWGQLTTQARVIRFGRSDGAERGEIWGTFGGDLAIPLSSSIAATLGGHFTQIRLYVEATRRENSKVSPEGAGISSAGQRSFWPAHPRV